MKEKMETLYYCPCGKELKVKAILVAKMNYCYICGKAIDQEYVNELLDEYKLGIAIKKEMQKALRQAK